MKNVTSSKKCFECKLCCLLSEKEKDLAPYFSQKEAKLVNKNKLVKSGRGGKLLQVKMLRSKAKKGYYRCSFLDEKTHRCSIYKKRPIDCITWPFIIGWDKGRKDVYLWIADTSFCPSAVPAKEIKKTDIADNVVVFLKSKGFFEEIRRRERHIWPYQEYQVKLKKITKLIF